MENLVASSRRRAALSLDRLATLEPQIAQAALCVVGALEAGGKILIAGNGGSAADAQHFAAELVVKFGQLRAAIPAIALTTDTSILTAAGNDFGFNVIFKRQLEALAKPGDVFIGITTSGQSPNILQALEYAESHNVRTLLLTSLAAPSSASSWTVTLRVPTSETSRAQELHEFILQTIAGIVERTMSKSTTSSRDYDPFPFHIAGQQWDAYSSWCRETNQNLVVVNGCFDLFHHGHRQLLQFAASRGDSLLVLLNSDESVSTLKGNGRPFMPIENRIDALRTSTGVSHVAVFDEETPTSALRLLQPRYLVKGDDYEGVDIPERAVVEEYGGEILYFAHRSVVSTTLIDDGDGADHPFEPPSHTNL